MYDPETGANRSIDLHQPIGTVVPHTADTVLVALLKGLVLLDLASERIVHNFGTVDESPDVRWNDGKCDARGRLWCGTMGFNGEPGWHWQVNKLLQLTVIVQVGVHCTDWTVPTEAAVTLSEWSMRYVFSLDIQQRQQPDTHTVH